MAAQRTIPETREIPLSQLHPAPWNPRLIKDKRFQQLCRSLEADSAFLWERPVLATLDGTIYAGNMRYRAAEHLGWSSIPARLVDIPEQLAKERAMRDNNQFGEWQEDDLAELLASLCLSDSDLESLGFDDARLAVLLDMSGMEDGRVVDPDKALDEWRGMPEFEHEDKTAYQTIAIHFKDQVAVDAFADLIGQTINTKTRYLWFPEIEIQHYGDKQWADES